MNIPSSVFRSTTFLDWRIKFVVNLNQQINGTAYLSIKLNQLPQNGWCNISQANGFALSTNFIIVCSNWIDLDGQIVKYEYFSKNIILNYD